jgi:mRNA-degrading endonuclease YafQ of YafQ-DinJ toxin-antitoxin module
MILQELFEAKPPAPERKATFAFSSIFEESWSRLKTPKAVGRFADFKNAKVQRPPSSTSHGLSDHSLSPGPLADYNECHLDRNCLLIYSDKKDVVTFYKCVTHDELDGRRKEALAKQLKKL